ncbi:hypothetical protein GN956_G3753 [Arapaima gigas]
MSPTVELVLFVCCWQLYEALTTKIETQGSTEADFGEKVTFSCRLSESRGVRQVTWLRLRSSGSVDSLASYSPHHGAAVSEQFLGRVLLTEVTLHSTSITLQNVTLEDEGCYICTFNIYPGGSTRKQTCLTVWGITEVTRKRLLDGPAVDAGSEVLLTSSAPLVRWGASEDSRAVVTETESNTTNHDGIATASSSLTPNLFESPRARADCVVGGAGTRETVVRRICLEEDRLASSTDGNTLPLTGLISASFVILSTMDI